MANTSLLEAFFPSWLLDYFEAISYQTDSNQYIFEMEEKNIPPDGYERAEVESKGFYQGGDITDFPLRGKQCIYKIKRRKWKIKKSGKLIDRNWNIIAKGTRITEEFASFLKGLN